MKAATPKTDTQPANVDGFLAAVPEDARAALEKVRKAIRAAAPQATEALSYGVPAFKLNGSPLVSYAAAKGHCSLYVMSPAVMEAHAEELKGYDQSKGTIRFPANKPLPAALIKKLVKARIAENEARTTKTKPAQRQTKGSGVAKRQTSDPEHDLPTQVGKPALRALLAAGYTRLDQLATVTQADLLKLHGMGPKAVGVIRDALKAKAQTATGTGVGNTIPAAKEQVFDSPTGWVRKHIHEYVESGGQKGHRWRGYPTLLLTTRGRKSGVLRRTALIYGQDGARYLLVASNGGAPDHPSWYLNLIENPQVELQVGADTFAARARIANSKETTRLWDVMTKVFPTYDSYLTKAAKAGRDISLVIVEPV